jgi:hypothetical protein
VLLADRKYTSLVKITLGVQITSIQCLYKYTVPASQKADCFPITNVNRLIMYLEKITAYIHNEELNDLYCSPNMGLSNQEECDGRGMKHVRG